MSKVNRNLIIIAVICFILGTATRIINNLPPSNPYDLTATEKAKLGKLAPQFTFTDLKGKTHHTTDFAGKTIVINFWATWCPPCVVEFPQMLNLARETKDTAVYIFVSNDSKLSPVTQFTKKLEETHKAELAQDNVFITHDDGKTITHNLYQTYRLPETYIIAPDQTLADKIIGPRPWDAPEMIEKIRGTAKNGG